MNDNESKQEDEFAHIDKFKISSSCEILPEPKSNDKHLVENREKNTSKSFEKNFQHRESTLTQLLHDNVHLQSLKNFIWAMIAVFILDHLIVDCYLNNQLKDDFSFLAEQFEGLNTIIFVYWTFMLFTTLFIVYYGFKLWTICRTKSTAFLSGMVDAAFLAIYVVYTLTFMLVSLNKSLNFPASARTVIIVEQVRMIMKGYAFVRTNAPKVIYPSQKGEKDNAGISEVPEFSKYVYYIFAPTLVYADDYPRIERIRWRFLFLQCFEFIAFMVLVSILAKNVFLPYFLNYDLKQTGVVYLIYFYSRGMFYSFLIFLLAFYSLSHLWLNVWAEILRFGDRKFYSTWWCSTSMSEYYRYWNILVQDWIYIYLFRDFKKILRKNRILTIIGTMFVSSMVHDYLFGVISGIYFPYFIISYGLSMLTFVVPLPNNAISNAYVFVCLSIAGTLLISYMALDNALSSARI